MLRERGLGSVPIFHDVAYSYRTPLDLSRMEAHPDIDWVGLNLYRPPWEHRPLADRARFLAGSTRLPFVPELGAGVWAHHVATPTPPEQEFVNLSILMYGIKAFNFYMLVERDRWQGSPIMRHGECRPDYAVFYAQFLEFLRRLEFWPFRRAPRVLVVLSYDLERFEAANSTLNFGHTDLLGLPAELFDDTRDLGLRWDRAAVSWLTTLKDCLHSACIDYDLADTHVDPARLERYEVVFVQTCDFMSRVDQDRLLSHRDRLVIGPGVPVFDEYLRPYSALDGVRRAAESELGDIVRALPPSEFRLDDARLDVVLHTDGSRRLLFIANPSTDRVASRVRFEGKRTFTLAWGPSRTITAEAELEITLDSYQVQIWQVTP